MTIAVIVICLVFIPLILVVFGKLIERKYGYIKKKEDSINDVHPIFADDLPPRRVPTIVTVQDLSELRVEDINDSNRSSLQNYLNCDIRIADTSLSRNLNKKVATTDVRSSSASLAVLMYPKLKILSDKQRSKLAFITP